MSNKNIYKFKPLTFERIKINDIRKESVPKERSGHRTVSDGNGNVYSFGGFNPFLDNDNDLRNDTEWRLTKPLFKELWHLNMSTKVWTKLKTTGDAPQHLASHCAGIIDNYLIVYGGTGVPFGHNSSNHIHMCNLQTLHWHLIKVNECEDNPIAQYGQGFIIDNDNKCIYIVGGTTGFTFTIDVHKFDFKHLRWECLYKRPQMKYNEWPEERYRHEIAHYNNRIYVFGGGTADECHDIKDIPIFDIITRQWLRGKSIDDDILGYPMNRRCHGFVQIEHNAYIIGGFNGIGICDDIWSIDLRTLKWKKFRQNMPLPSYFSGAAVSPYGEITIFGGVINPDYHTRSKELYSIWVKIPSLKEISWNAVTHYLSSNKSVKTSQSIINLGIPPNYLHRYFSPNGITTNTTPHA